MGWINCCNSKCGIRFFVDDTYEKAKQEDHSSFFCPNGHGQHFYGQSETERLRKLLGQERNVAVDNANTIKRLKGTNAALKAWITRLKRK